MNIVKILLAVLLGISLTWLAAVLAIAVGVGAYTLLTFVSAPHVLATAVGTTSAFTVAFVALDWAWDGRVTDWIAAP